MTKTPEELQSQADAEHQDQIDAAKALEQTGAAVALALTGLVNDMLKGEKRVCVISGPMKADGPGGVAWRHSISIEPGDPMAAFHREYSIERIMFDALGVAEAQFIAYARSHEAKGAPDKAATNLDMALKCRNAMNFAINPVMDPETGMPLTPPA